MNNAPITSNFDKSKCPCGHNCDTICKCICFCICGKKNQVNEDINNILKNTKFIEETSSKTKIFEKNGDYIKALEDFESLRLINVRPISKGKVGVLPDGTMVNVRFESTDSRPTLEIQLKNGNRTIKIRYN